MQSNFDVLMFGYKELYDIRRISIYFYAMFREELRCPLHLGPVGEDEPRDGRQQHGDDQRLEEKFLRHRRAEALQPLLCVHLHIGERWAHFSPIVLSSSDISMNT